MYHFIEKFAPGSHVFQMDQYNLNIPGRDIQGSFKSNHFQFLCITFHLDLIHIPIELHEWVTGLWSIQDCIQN